MSERSIELHRQAYAIFNVHDIEAFIALFDPRCEFHSAFVAVGGVTVYRGHDGLRRWNRDFEDVWGDEIRIEPEAYFDLGERTLALATLYGRGRQSGAETTMRVAQVARWRDGLCVYLKSYADREEALGELNISAGELVPIAP